MLGTTGVLTRFALTVLRLLPLRFLEATRNFDRSILVLDLDTFHIRIPFELLKRSRLSINDHTKNLRLKQVT